MPVRRLVVVAAVVLCACATHPAGVTAQAKKKDAAKAPAKPVEVTLKFDREVFVYPSDGRRDPFTPLTGKNRIGPRFEDLNLSGIIYSRDPSKSLALLTDADKKIYRLRRGDRVGDIRIVDIGPRRVVVSVESFGRARQEVLELKRKGVEGATQ